jgi:hypothetical protein
MKGIKSFWDGLSSMQKMIVVVLIIVILWVIWNKTKGTIKGVARDISNNSEAGQLQQAGMQASYPAENYKGWAKEIFNALNPAGSVEQTVYRILGYMNNDVDFIKLDQAFGVREASDNWFGLVEDKDLNGWILDEFSSEEVAKCNAILKSHGVTKRFR